MAGQQSFTRTETPTGNGTRSPKPPRPPLPPDPNGLLTVAQAAARLGLPKSYLYEETGKGSGSRIPHVRIGRHIRFDPAALDAWIRAQTVGGSRAEEDLLSPRRRTPLRRPAPPTAPPGQTPPQP
jgi:excisionase family DNA binding protein